MSPRWKLRRVAWSARAGSSAFGAAASEELRRRHGATPHAASCMSVGPQVTAREQRRMRVSIAALICVAASVKSSLKDYRRGCTCIESLPRRGSRSRQASSSAAPALPRARRRSQRHGVSRPAKNSAHRPGLRRHHGSGSRPTAWPARSLEHRFTLRERGRRRGQPLACGRGTPPRAARPGRGGTAYHRRSAVV